MGSKVPVDRQPVDGRDFSRLMTELRQWNVFRVAAAYGVASWLLVQIISTVGPAFAWPTWVLRAFVLAAVVGFLVTMGALLFRPKSEGAGRLPIYLSRRARLTAAIGVLLVAAAAATLSIRSLSAREQVSIAVLPFADLSTARDRAFFAEGVAEEILSTLAAEKGIKVLGRTSSRQIAQNADPKVIRESLGVTHLLEGSTRSAGDQLRVNVRLIDTADGSQLWEEEYQGRLADVFGVQDKIAAKVVQRLRGTFFEGAVKEARPTSIDAYQTYLAARALMSDPKKDSLTQAWRMARQIIDTHPDYAPGHALYASATWLLADDPYSYGHFPVDKARRVAVAHARNAIRLAPDQADGYAALGLVSPPPDSLAPLQKAIALDPSRASLRSNLGIDLNILGRHDEAFEQYRLSVEIDPLIVGA